MLMQMRGERIILKRTGAAPAPLFAAQPAKVFCRGFFSKKPERSRLKFFGIPFFQKRYAGDQESLPACLSTSVRTAFSASVMGASGLRAGPTGIPVTSSMAGRMIELGRMRPFWPQLLQKR